MSVIREDTVAISFDVENNPFAELTKSMDNLKKACGVAVDDSTDNLKELAKTAKNASKSFTDLAKSAKNSVKIKVDSGLSKLASIPDKARASFDKLKNSMQKIKNIKLSDIGKSLNKGLGSAITKTVDGSKKLFTALKKAASVGFEKVVNGLKSAANYAGKATVALGKGLVKGTKYAMVGIGAAATAVSALVTKSVMAYADYEQLVGGVETLFKGSAPVVQQYAQEAYKTSGLSANQYMDTVTSFSASLIQSLGGDTKKAAEYAQTAIIDMADNANKMGTDMSSIQDAYQGFAKQNYTIELMSAA